MNDRADAGLPAEVLDLIANHLESVDQAELLLLLARDDERAWTVDEAAHELRQDAPDSLSLANKLAGSGLLDSSAGPRGVVFRYAPRTPALRYAVESLKKAYDTRPVTLVKAIYDRPPSAVRSFAESFRLREREK